MDLDVALPEIATLPVSGQLEVARWIRGEVRPQLIARLKHLQGTSESDTDEMLDRLEADLRLQQVNAYAAELETLIQRHAAPIPSEQMPIRLHDLKIEPEVEASARTELYFSPTTKCIAHGPDVLRFALCLAEHLLQPGEVLEELEVAHWRRVILSNLRLKVRARESDQKSSALYEGDATASVLGTIRTSAGRQLDYRGDVLPAYPIFEESGHNECALAALRPFNWVKLDGKDALHLALPPAAPWLDALNQSRSFGLFMLVELLGLLTGLKSGTASATHLSVKVEGVQVPPRLGDLFRTGIIVEYERILEQAVERFPHTWIIPFQYRFRPFQQKSRNGRMAVTELSIPELMALSDR